HTHLRGELLHGRDPTFGPITDSRASCLAVIADEESTTELRQCASRAGAGSNIRYRKNNHAVFWLTLPRSVHGKGGSLDGKNGKIAAYRRRRERNVGSPGIRR